MAKYQDMTLRQVQIIKRALAIAYEATMKKIHDGEQDNKLEAADYFSMYALLNDNPNLALQEIKRG